MGGRATATVAVHHGGRLHLRARGGEAGLGARGSLVAGVVASGAARRFGAMAAVHQTDNPLPLADLDSDASLSDSSPVDFVSEFEGEARPPLFLH